MNVIGSFGVLLIVGDTVFGDLASVGTKEFLT
jgi:hypothetical protein